MSKHSFNNVSQETIDSLERTSAALADSSMKKQKEQIKRDSPYSEEINQAFSGYDEFAYLASLGLVEAHVTRHSLIREIDFDLYITFKRCTNRELMLRGLSPYAKDDPNSGIVLHHIGQTEDAPFAELTWAEHAQCGNAKILHSSTQESWRKDFDLEKKYMAEKTAYWRKRVANEITVCEQKDINTIILDNVHREERVCEMQIVLERLFAECSISDLNYISNLAQSYILAKEIGAHTVEEFILSLSEETGNIRKCPACNGTDISLYGSYRTDKEKKQKYRCKSCGKVFSVFYNTIIQGCTLSLFEWLRFIDCLYNGYSIKRTAELCNISETTAFQNRLRLFYALSLLDERVVLKGKIAIDEKYEEISYKGNHSLQEDFSMPRKARKRGQESHTRGLSKNKVCIICALDEYGNSIAKVGGKGGPTAHRIDLAISKNIDKDSVKMLYSDKSSAIRKFAKDNAFPIQQECLRKPDYKNGTAYETVRQIQRVNSYHSRLEKFLNNFNGISSELLQGYTSLFAWKERYRDQTLMDAYKELLSIMVTPNLYKSVESIIAERAVLHSPLAEKKPGVHHFQNKESKEKAEQIYALYAKGSSLPEIAKKYGCTRQAVGRRIKQFRLLGLAYKTDKEIAKENANRVFKEFELEKLESYKRYCDRCFELLRKKENWDGTNQEFLVEMQKRYGLAQQTIKNNIAIAKRVLNLREVFYVSEQYEYLGLKEMFEAVYARYNEILKSDPSVSLNRCCSILAKEFKYTQTMVWTIVTRMRDGTIDWDGKLKLKIPMAQTLNRDRSVFLDCLKWTGTRTEFLRYAAQKYGISTGAINQILMLNCMADPNRYEISKLD